MEKRNVAGLRELKWAVVSKEDNVVISLCKEPLDAERLIGLLPDSEKFEVVELRDAIGYRQG